ncbi:hypothetical protein TNCV_87621 [Trichonephila clavipes]|nr:hypothetical protein TNCV_87621 [Trichonephila clavipes]
MALTEWRKQGRRQQGLLRAAALIAAVVAVRHLLRPGDQRINGEVLRSGRELLHKIPSVHHELGPRCRGYHLANPLGVISEESRWQNQCH